MKTLNLTNLNCEDKSCQIVTSSIEKGWNENSSVLFHYIVKKGSKNSLLWKSIWSMNIVLFIDKKMKHQKIITLLNLWIRGNQFTDQLMPLQLYMCTVLFRRISAHTFWNKVPPNIRSIITLNNFPLQIHIHYRSDAT